MINRVVLVGRLTRDPELKYTPSGVANVRFTIAVNRTFTGQNGEREADFINVVAWRKQAENLANYQRKGALIGVEGRIQTGSYEGQDGKRVYTTDVIADSIQFLEPRANGEQRGQQAGGYNQAPQGQGGYNQAPPTQQGGYNQAPQGQGGYNQAPPMQENYTRIGQDPFANTSKGPIEVSDDDLPF